MKLMHRFVAAIATVLICNGAQALDANEEITPSDMGYQYWVYSVTWQPSFCQLKPDTAGCNKPPQTFLTHGIWPYNNSTPEKTNRHPAFCNTSPSCKLDTECAISEDKLESIARKPEIAKLVTTNPQGMFRHEWKKHGTCSGKTEEDYFNDLVTLRKVVDYNKPMFEAWIGHSVMFDDLKKAFPANASFRCFIQDGKQYLHEVFYRVSPDGTAYTDDSALQIGTRCNSQQTYIPAGT
ncbi:hypothetical protein HKK55_01655 [Pseudomonas sp. ADAK18]|uniref:ribonuclease T2 family protein n=1 Tax=Pseudomonas sp. ADAK18 TaxID=2730848 RepID=UPI001462828B|nr:hypothetical protein [Pseudomonas sp. ADAK18]QJI27456.1 hypothetical protein HKK55_01655 [Pseudomonas sp. ADAK18]